MRLTETQWARLAEGPRAVLERRLAPRMGDAAAVHAAIDRALGLGLRSFRAAASYAALTALFGPAFRDLPWCSALDDASLGPPCARMMRVLDEAFAGLSEDGGPEGWRELVFEAAALSTGLLDNPIVPREALLGLKLAPRDAEERPGQRARRAFTQHDAPGSHWVVPVGQGDVVIEAETRPHEERVWRRLEWLGGSPVPSAPHRRKVSRATPGRHRLTALLDGRSDAVEVWVVDAYLELTELSADRAAMVATLVPREVASFVREGWRLRRECQGVRIRNGEVHEQKGVVPEGGPVSPRGGQLHDTVPCALGQRDTACAENHRAWLEWRGEPCSNNVEWHVRMDRRATDVAPGWLDPEVIRDMADPH